MTVDDVLEQLRFIDKPRVPAPRLPSAAREAPRRSPLMIVYWLLVAFLAAPLATSMYGIVLIAALAAFATIPTAAAFCAALFAASDDPTSRRNKR